MSKEWSYSTPEQEGISSSAILNFLKEVKLAEAEIHGIAIAVHGKIIFERYQAPYAKEIPHTSHSLTKCFTNTAFGLAYTKGLVDVDDLVLTYFPQYQADANEYLQKLTIRHLLTMRSGQVRKVQGNEWRPLKTSWIDAYFQIPWDKEPGSEFMYSSGNSYIVSAIVQKVTGMSCDEYIRSNLSEKLGLGSFTWQKSPEGICSGGNGVNICVEDILKIGQLYLNGGVWGGEQLLCRDWIDMSLGYVDAVRLNPGEPEYNFHWRRTGDVYSSRGMFGQACALIPKLDMAVAVTMASRKHCAAELLQTCVVEPTVSSRGKILTEQEITENQRKLEDYAKGMTLKILPDHILVPESYRKPCIFRYRPEPSEDGIKAVTLQFEEKNVLFSFSDERGVHTVQNGIHEWRDGFSSVTGHYLHHQYEFPRVRISACAYWISEKELMFEWRYPEMPFWDHVKLTFLNDGSIKAKRWVNMNSEATERPELRAYPIL